MGFYNMMSGWSGGWVSWTMYLGMIVFWVGVAALVIWGISGMVGTGQVHVVPQLPQESAVDVLKRRYAAGEIDVAEFEHKKRDLL